MQDEVVVYVAGHPLLNRRCTNSNGLSASKMTYIVLDGALNALYEYRH